MISQNLIDSFMRLWRALDCAALFLRSFSNRNNIM